MNRRTPKIEKLLSKSTSKNQLLFFSLLVSKGSNENRADLIAQAEDNQLGLLSPGVEAQSREESEAVAPRSSLLSPSGAPLSASSSSSSSLLLSSP